MLFNPNPGAPPIPFPTALPGAGVYIQAPVSGQHESNPTKLRIHVLRKRPTGPRPRLHKAIWQYWYYGYPGITYSPLQMAKAIQATFAGWWAYILTPLQRSAWASLSSAYTATNMFGQTRNLSGWGMFLHCNWNTLFQTGWPYFLTGFMGPPGWTDPPTSWPALTPPSLTIVSAYAVPAGYYYGAASTLQLLLTWNNPNPPPYPTLCVLLGKPGRSINGRRQLQLSPAAFQRDISGGPVYTKSFMLVSHPAALPGKNITVATKFVLYPDGGESPLQYTQLQIKPWPPPPWPPTPPGG